MKKSTPQFFLAVFLLVIAPRVNAQLINTITGNGVAGHNADGGPATTAQLAGPVGIAVDKFGDIFIADSMNNIIRMVDPSGIISTVAGGGTVGGLGDGGKAVDATLNNPTGVAVDNSGNLFIADYGNNRIREVIKATGVIITFAGGGILPGEGVVATLAKLNGPFGVRVNTAGDVIIADRGNDVIRKVSGGVINTIAGTWGTPGLTLDGGPATNAELNQPTGVVVDIAGNFYIADPANNVVRKVTSGGTISTIAGNNMLPGGYTGEGVATLVTLNQPYGVAVDNALNVYIADYGNNRIRMVKPTGIISTVTGSAGIGYLDGTVAAAKLNGPTGIWCNPAGTTLYVAEGLPGNNDVRKIFGGNVSTMAGNGTAGYTVDGGPAVGAELNQPNGVAVDAAGDVFIADQVNNVIREITPAGVISTVAGSLFAGNTGDGASAVAAQLNAPTGICISGGNIYVADAGNNRIRVFTVGGPINAFAGTGVAGYSDGGGAPLSAQFTGPVAVKADAVGNVFIADAGNNVIREISSLGIISTVAGNNALGAGHTGDNGSAIAAQLNNPTGVAVDPAGNIYVADAGNNCVRVFQSGGNIYQYAGTTAPGSADGAGFAATFISPADVQYDPISQNIYVADAGNSKVRTISTKGGIAVNSMATAGLNYLAGETFTVNGGTATGTVTSVNPLTGAVLTYTITSAGAGYQDANFVAITLVPAGPGSGFSINISSIDPVVGTYAGTTGGFFGDGGPALSGKINAAHGVGVDATGNLYIADNGNNRIRKVAVGGTHIITTTGGNGTAGYGGQATSLELQNPTGVCSDGTNIFIADANNNVVRKIDAAGVMHTIVGTGAVGHTGDAGPANLATLWHPTGVCFDGSNLFIADNNNQVIREVYLLGSGFINIVAGTYGTPSYTGELVDPLSAYLDFPFGVACDISGNLFIADTRNSRIRAVGEVHVGFVVPFDKILTLAGNLTSVSGYGGLANYVNMNLPSGTAISSSGIIYIADQGNNIVRMIDAIGVIHTIAGNGIAGYTGEGAATAVELNAPTALAYDDVSGNLYIADMLNQRIRKLVIGTGLISTISGNGTVGYAGDGLPAASGVFNYPSGLDLDINHNLFIADKNNERVRKIDFALGTINTVAGTGVFGWIADGGPALSAELNAPYGTCADTFGNVYIADRNNSIIRKVNQVSGLITTYAGGDTAGYGGDNSLSTAPVAKLDGPISLALDKNLNLYICDQGNNVIRMVDYATRNLHTIAGIPGLLGVGSLTGPALSAKFYYPTGICMDPTGTILYIADGNNNEVKQLPVLPVVTNVTIVAGTGVPGYLYGGSPLTAELNDPIGVTTDPAGNLFIADFSNNTVAKVKSDLSALSLFAGNNVIGYSGDKGPATAAQLNEPTSVASDASGNIFIADMGNQRIRLVNTSNIIKTVAGKGTIGYTGDGGAAPLAELNDPFGVSVDTVGNYYIADRNNNVIRKVKTVLLAGFSESAGAICQDSCITVYNTTIGATDLITWSTVPATGVIIAAPNADTTTICFNSAGSYSITLTATYHGKNNATTTPVTVSPTPFPVIIPAGFGFNLTLSGAYITFQWNKNGTPIAGATTASYTVPGVTSGTFTVTVDSNGCIGTSTGVFVRAALGLTTPYAANNYWLSRQDNNTAMLHSAQPLDDNLAIGIFDATGRDILDDNWKQSSTSLQVNGASLPPGLYLIKLTNKNTSSVLRWMKD
jgi:sugar lactone lactonase YvrE